jgi:hypothetical protein
MRPTPKFYADDTQAPDGQGHCILPLTSVCELLRITIETDTEGSDNPEERCKIMRVLPLRQIVARSRPGECPWEWLRRTNLMRIAEARWKGHTSAAQRARLKRPV